MMAQNAVARATAPAGGAGIGCWSFQTPGPVSSRSSGGKADGGLPSRSGIATGTGPRGRRTPVAAGRVQPLTPVELRPLPSAPALQIPELLPSPALQSASSADAPRPAARPPLPLLVSFRPLREAQLAPAQPPPLSRSARRAGSRSRAGVRPGAPRSAPGASAAPALSGSPSLARAQLCRAGASSLAQLQPHGRHMDAITNVLALHCHRLSS